jgi:putative photosynthetic complex assembly protein
VLPAGNAGFVRGVLRALTRNRRGGHTDKDAPVRLARLADGRLTLKDLATERVIELNSFGPTNVAAFAVFLTGHPSDPAPDSAQNARPAQAGQTGKTL